MTRNEYAAHAALSASRTAHPFNASAAAARATLEAYRSRKASRSILSRLFGVFR